MSARLAPRAARLLARGGTARDDEGAVLVIFALAMTTLLGCLALSVDLGNVAQTHRNVQDAADSAAVSAAQVLALGGNQASAVAEVEQIAGAYLPDLTAASWTGCTDTGAAALGFRPLGGPGSTPCVSFDGQAVRVTIPVQPTAFFFGGAIGSAKGINVVGSAEATDRSGSGQLCTTSGPNPQDGNCSN